MAIGIIKDISLTDSAPWIDVVPHRRGRATGNTSTEATCRLCPRHLPTSATMSQITVPQ